MTAANKELDEFMAGLIRRNPGETEFHQAVREVSATILPFLATRPEFREARVLERLTEADRIIIFRVGWEDDQGNIRSNRGYRVQWSSAIGPYKGGLRFHKNVTLSILKFLAFEQTFKNSLTGLPMGGGKGGSNFNPKVKSDREIMRFCQSFMSELYRHIGPYTDIPAGDIGVGTREVSYLFGQYKRLANQFTGVITGKGLAFGGSEIRVEATGYGCVYMMEDMLKHHGHSIDGMTAVVSGAGNVAQYTVEKLNQLGATVVTVSDSTGFVHDPEGINEERLDFIKTLKAVRRGSLGEYAKEYGVKFYEGERPWAITADLAFPCATQNEVSEDDAKTLVKNGCIAVAEGANMPTVKSGIDVFQDAGVLFAPSKAANAGGVATSGLEMTQNSMRLSWSRDELNQRLRDIMADIHASCVEYGQGKDRVDYMKGANIAAFVKLADAISAYGVM
ncbi:MAG: NADP-specific glutamate dehydrogenase [Gammaproteobacteria bacterium]|nr:NADP-specific glutamate dehydrogenase [Gammaproteobacteria bacterium]